MNESNLFRPPVGGADLECYLAYDQLTPSDAANILKARALTRLQPTDKDPFVVTDKEFSPIDMAAISRGDKLFEFVEAFPTYNVILNYRWEMGLAIISVNLVFRFSEKVVVVSTMEDMLWGFSSDVSQLDFRRLQEFYSLCESICEIKAPKYALLGSEPCHARDISVDNPDNATRAVFDHKEFFSERSKRLTFDWYVSIYAKRWDGQ